LEDTYIRSMKVRNWKKVAQNRDSWKKAVEQARTLYRLYRFTRRRRYFHSPCSPTPSWRKQGQRYIDNKYNFMFRVSMAAKNLRCGLLFNNIMRSGRFLTTVRSNLLPLSSGQNTEAEPFLTNTPE